MPYSLVSGPLALPISLTQAKKHLRVDDTDQDYIIDGLIRAAVEDVQNEAWRQLITATYDIFFDAFPGGIWRMPRAPLRNVASVKYLDTNGVLQTLAPSTYLVDTAHEPGRIALAYQQYCPPAYSVPNNVTVRVVCGYATPFDANAGLLTAAGHPYADGDLVRLSTTEGALPAGLAIDTDYYARDVVTGVSLKLAATPGGTATNTTTGGTGTHFLGVIPQPLIAAMLLTIGHLYENRGEVSNAATHELPLAARRLVSPYRLATP
jgi:uncharacterized phiE125 gp8 family phage protein